MNTPTPRTDAVREELHGSSMGAKAIRYADLAYQLERDLAAREAELATMKEFLAPSDLPIVQRCLEIVNGRNSQLHEAREELARVRESLAFVTKANETLMRIDHENARKLERAEAALAEARKNERERAAKVAREVFNRCGQDADGDDYASAIMAGE